MFEKKLIKYLEEERDRLHEEVVRLSVQNNELVSKVMALSSERAYLLTNGISDEADSFEETYYDEWGQGMVEESK